MTPLESLLRAAEALRDVMMKVYDYEAGVAPVVGRFDSALARYRAEPDPITCEGGIEARLNVVDAVQEQEMDARIALQRRVLELERRQHVRDLRGKYADPQVREAEAEVVRAAEAYRDHSHAGNFTKLYGAVDALRAARAVREGQNEQGDESRSGQGETPAAEKHVEPAMPVGRAGATAGASGASTRNEASDSGDSAVRPAQTGVSSSASPPAFARETPREWSTAQRAAAYHVWDADHRNVENVCAEIAKHAHLFVDAPLTAEEEDRIADAVRCPPSPPPETRTDMTEAEHELADQIASCFSVLPYSASMAERARMAEQAARIATRFYGKSTDPAVPPAQPPKRELGLDEEALVQAGWDAMARAWEDEKGIDGERRACVCEVVRLVSEHVARVTAEAAALDSARKSSDAQCDGVRKDLATLKAECERLTHAVDQVGKAHAFERERADAAERKLSEEERALTHAREEIHRLTKEVNAAEKKLEVLHEQLAASELARLDERKQDAAAPAPDEAIETQIGKCAVEIGDLCEEDYCYTDIKEVLRRFWPSPAVGRGVTLPERIEYDRTRESNYCEGWNACLDEVKRLNAALGVTRKGEA